MQKRSELRKLRVYDLGTIQPDRMPAAPVTWLLITNPNLTFARFSGYYDAL